MLRANLAVLTGLAASLLSPQELRASPGDPVLRFPLNAPASQDFAWDGETYYVTNFFNGKIHRYTPDFRSIPPAFDSPFSSGWGLTGIAYDSIHRTLWIAEPLSRQIAEIDALNGTPTGKVIAPEFKEGIGASSLPLPRGMAFDPRGNGSNGSLYVAESQTSLIYEIDLDGRILNFFSHPDDPDGYPGEGGAGQAYDVEVLHDAEGNLTGYYVMGARDGIDWIRRLDASGAYTGFRIPLSRAGGPVYALMAGAFPRPGGAPIDPAMVVLVASKAEIAVLDGTEEPIGEIFNLDCAVQDGSVRLSWRSGSVYDRIELYRDCRLWATYPGDASTATEGGLGPGVYRLSLKGILGEGSTESGECTAVGGGGRLIRSSDYEGSYAADLTVDQFGYVYVSDLYDRNIHVYDEDLNHLSVIGLPFLTKEDQITGIAYSSDENGLLFIYNAEKNLIYTTDMEGKQKALVGVPLPNDPQDPLDKAGVIGMTYIPQGQEGRLWILESTREKVYSLDLQGNILSSFPHPVSIRSPIPSPSRIHNYMWGLSEVPGLGSDHLDLTSGTFFEAKERILRVDTRTGEALGGVEIPLDDLDRIASDLHVGIQHAVRNSGKPTLYVASGLKVAELDPIAPDPRPITGFTARQIGREDRVLLSFDANDTYSRIEVGRDCRPLLVLDAGEFSPGKVEIIDKDVPAGLQRYDIRGLKGGLETSFNAVDLRVGPGAILDRAFDFPLLGTSQLSRDPVDGTFLASSRSQSQARSLFRFRPDLTFDSVLTNVIPDPWEIATMAVRPAGSATGFIYVIAWKEITQIGAPQDFPMFILDRDGNIVDEKEVKPPKPSNGFSIYPTALCWNPDEGLFWYLERNSSTLVIMDAEGSTRRLIPHPAPPLQSYVFNVGMSFDPGNGTFLLTSAGPEDHTITKVLQLTRGGRLTGIEIPLDGVPLTTAGIDIEGFDLVIGGSGAVGELMRLQAFQPLPAPLDLACIARGGRALLTFRPGGTYDHMVVLRDGREVAVLAGDASSYLDTPPARDRYFVYSVAGRIGARTGKNAVCELPPHTVGFIRGDADGVDGIQITDVIFTLNYLFLGGAEPPCDDAADADDDGTLTITDLIAILQWLYLGGADLPLPFPGPGEDPTPDSLTCS